MSELTVQDIIDAYLANLKMRLDAGDYSRGAYTLVCFELGQFAKRHGKKRISECRQFDMSQWINEHADRWKSAHTKKRVASQICGAFHWAEEEELIDRAPYRSPRMLRRIAAKPRRPATLAEYCALMRKCNRSMRRALMFLRRTGCRTCEMRQVLWRDVELDGDNPQICLVDHKTARSSGMPRMIGLDPGLVRFLRNLKRQAIRDAVTTIPAHLGKAFEQFFRGQSEAQRTRLVEDLHVFVNSSGGPWDCHTFARQLRRTATKIGLDDGVIDKVSGYGLRHLYVVHAIESGVSTRMIADQIGHAKTDMIDKCYGSHTRYRAKHLNNVAKEIQQRRKRSKKPGEGKDGGA